jgi:thiol-disulfide isomerase/thioredoxin
VTRRRGALLLGVAALALVAGLLLRTRLGHDVAPQPVPAALPLLELVLPDPGGQPQRLDQWRGKVLVVNFWATWCAPCREEIPVLIDAQTRLAQRGVQVVGIAIDQAEKAGGFAAEMGINYPVLIGELETMDVARAAGNDLGGLPFTIVVDRNGRIARTELGGVTKGELEAILEPLL